VTVGRAAPQWQQDEPPRRDTIDRPLAIQSPYLPFCPSALLPSHQSDDQSLAEELARLL